MMPRWAAWIDTSLNCFFNKWWRPIGCAGIVAAIWTNGVIVPILSRTVPDMGALAVFCSTFAALAGIREWAKIKGTA